MPTRGSRAGDRCHRRLRSVTQMLERIAGRAGNLTAVLERAADRGRSQSQGSRSTPASSPPAPGSARAATRCRSYSDVRYARFVFGGTRHMAARPPDLDARPARAVRAAEEIAREVLRMSVYRPDLRARARTRRTELGVRADRLGVRGRAGRRRLASRLWLRDYLAEIERQRGLEVGRLPAFRSIVVSAELERCPRTSCPALLIASPGTEASGRRSRRADRGARRRRLSRPVPGRLRGGGVRARQPSGAAARAAVRRCAAARCWSSRHCSRARSSIRRVDWVVRALRADGLRRRSDQSRRDRADRRRGRRGHKPADGPARADAAADRARRRAAADGVAARRRPSTSTVTKQEE